jgi:hypothetical protein
MTSAHLVPPNIAIAMVKQKSAPSGGHFLFGAADSIAIRQKRELPAECASRQNEKSRLDTF